MARPRRLLPLVCIFLGVLAWSVRADDSEQAAETFNALFGADLARVRKTGDARDDAALAARLLETAKKATDQPAFLALVCETAADLGLAHPDGYAAAAEAMELVARSVPEKAAACRERLIEIRQKQFDAARGDERQAAGEALLDCLLPVIEAKEQAGAMTEAAALYRKAKTIAAAGSARADQIKSRAARLAWRMKTVVRVADVKVLLERDPGNVKAREGLVRIYLVDLDDPAEAAKHLKGCQDKDLLKYVAAAAKPVEAAPEFACLELGEWYARLAANAPAHAKAAMYARAKAYLDRFLKMHTSKDLNRTRGQVALEKVQEAAGKPTAAVMPTRPTKPAEMASGIQDGVIKAGQSVDLLPLVDVERDAKSGKWKRDASAILLDQGGGWRGLELPVRPEGDYIYAVMFRTDKGLPEVWQALALPDGRATTVVAFCPKGTMGLATVEGKHWTKNSAFTCLPDKLVPGREYTLVTRVTRTSANVVRVTASLGGQPPLVWEGTLQQVGNGSGQPRCLGIGTWGSSATFTAFRLKMLSGEARLLRPVEK